MKMKITSRITAMLAAVLLVFAGCNKDKGKDEAEAGTRLGDALSNEEFDAMAAGMAPCAHAREMPREGRAFKPLTRPSTPAH